MNISLTNIYFNIEIAINEYNFVINCKQEYKFLLIGYQVFVFYISHIFF